MIILFMEVSFTAQTMALQRAMETARPRSSRLFDDPLARDFLHGPLRAAAALSALPVGRRIIPALYDLIWPGPRPSAVARTRLIDDTLAGAIADGIAQVVLLGAGFDSRAWRLAALRRARVIEVDRPETQQAKVAALRRIRQPLELASFTPVDFERDDLAAAIRAAGLAADQPAVFVWEGVTNYLSPGAVDQTLSVIRALAAPGSLLLFTYVHQGVIDGSAHFPEAARWVRSVARAGEPWTFGLLPAALPGYLAARGFTLSWDVSTAEAGRRYFGPAGRRDRASGLYHVALAEVQCQS
jgi:methyltransferase (TIGR00027 family)